MERPPDERITRSVAREIAQREQLKALLAGSIVRLGDNYVVAPRGDQRADRRRHGARAGRSGDQGTGAERRSAPRSPGCAQKLGESLPSVQKFDVPLPRATTASLDALHAYSLALYEGREVPRLEAIPHLKRAIELDPDVCDGARASVGGVREHRPVGARAGVFAKGVRAARPGQRSRAVLHLLALLSRRDTGLGQGARARAIVDGHVSARSVCVQRLGNALIRLGQFEQSVEPLREAIRLDPQFVPAYGNLAAIAARAQPARRGESHAASWLRIVNSTSSAPAGCRICWRSSRAMPRRWRANWRRRSACGRRIRRSAGRLTHPPPEAG